MPPNAWCPGQGSNLQSFRNGILSPGVIVGGVLVADARPGNSIVPRVDKPSRWHRPGQRIPMQLARRPVPRDGCGPQAASPPVWGVPYPSSVAIVRQADLQEQIQNPLRGLAIAGRILHRAVGRPLPSVDPSVTMVAPFNR